MDGSDFLKTWYRLGQPTWELTYTNLNPKPTIFSRDDLKIRANYLQIVRNYITRHTNLYLILKERVERCRKVELRHSSNIIDCETIMHMSCPTSANTRTNSENVGVKKKGSFGNKRPYQSLCRQTVLFFRSSKTNKQIRVFQIKREMKRSVGGRTNSEDTQNLDSAVKCKQEVFRIWPVKVRSFHNFHSVDVFSNRLNLRLKWWWEHQHHPEIS